jgi:radical SAM-linked protein
MAYSAGFSPHPKISYANAAPTGVASEAEYVEIGVVQIVDPEKLLAVLDEVLPPGLQILLPGLKQVTGRLNFPAPPKMLCREPSMPLCRNLRFW